MMMMNKIEYYINYNNIITSIDLRNGTITDTESSILQALLE
jgi:hypothetical protein